MVSPKRFENGAWISTQRHLSLENKRDDEVMRHITSMMPCRSESARIAKTDDGLILFLDWKGSDRRDLRLFLWNISAPNC